ncbi:alpha/beta hydrolase fold domain-containing protein [Rhodospirillaceae bacterium KN72]|uniref:Alpha/beta hydrolase fold domain-containing protein n=1 Tax=Pacificispira spongiicola TaxID=2729598 RepID=A0A7Y0E346_9PROT|nr:alpha/beta hydrolase fold domain-containing protein [Pacificispira spongiicola]NMM45616.1 alpha/beta hydrolase fold domain-containing protein [Pacificispira spongiicola]
MPSIPFSVYRSALFAKIKRALGVNDDPYPPRPDGTTLSPSQGSLAGFDACRPALSFDPAADTDPATWRARGHAKLVEITGYHTNRDAPMVTASRAAESVGTGSDDPIVKRSFYLKIRPDTDLPVHLIHHRDATGPLPVFLHLAGSTSGVHLGWGAARVPIDHQRLSIGADMARQAARRGYLAVAIEQAGYGERAERHLRKKSPNRTIDLANHLLLQGRTLMGDSASDVSSAIDWILSQDAPVSIDPSRLFLFGHSAGGTLAQYAAALDDRIQGAMASGSVGPIRESIGMRGASGGDGIVPGLLKWLDTKDLIGLIAPRRFVGLSGRQDHIYPFSGVEKVVGGASKIYRAYGVADRIHAVAADGPHRYYSAESWEAWDAFIDPRPAPLEA